MQPVEHELRDRIVTGSVTVVPMLALGVAAGFQAADDQRRGIELPAPETVPRGGRERMMAVAITDPGGT